MMVSAFAKHLAACFGTVQTAPIAVGAGGNAGELVSFSGRTLPSITPMPSEDATAGPGRSAGRDHAGAAGHRFLDSLNALFKTEYPAGSVQAQFLDALSTSQTQVRSLASQLATTLGNITADD